MSLLTGQSWFSGRQCLTVDTFTVDTQHCVEDDSTGIQHIDVGIKLMINVVCLLAGG